MKTPEDMTDQELGEAVAVEVCGIDIDRYRQDYFSNPDYAHSLDALLPILERTFFRIERVINPTAYLVYIEMPNGTYLKVEDANLPRAICVALIKAARAKKDSL